MKQSLARINISSLLCSQGTNKFVLVVIKTFTIIEKKVETLNSWIVIHP